MEACARHRMPEPRTRFIRPCAAPANAAAGSADNASIHIAVRFHLEASYLGSDDHRRFMWDTHWGGDFDLIDYVAGRFGFLVDYQAVLGNEFRSFDPNQGNYIWEFSGSGRLGRTELAGVFHHVSRHLSDRPKRIAVAMNVAEVRLLRRFEWSGLTVDLKAEAGHMLQRAYVDYSWTGRST